LGIRFGISGFMPPIHHQDVRRISQLKRLKLACQSMFLVKRACEAALKRTDLSEDEVCVTGAGIAALYASPFTEGTGLGKLEDKFSSFADDQMRETHDGLIAYRNAFVAHRDLSNTDIYVNSETGEKLPFYSTLVTITKEGVVYTHAHFMTFSLAQFERVQVLAAFQLERLEKKSDKLFEQVRKRSRTTSPGTYVLGHDYP